MIQANNTSSSTIAPNLVAAHSRKVRKIKASRKNERCKSQEKTYIEPDITPNKREPSTIIKANGQTYELIINHYNWKGVQKTGISLFVNGNRILKLFTFKMEVKNIDLFLNESENNLYVLAGDRLKIVPIISCWNRGTFKNKKSKKLLTAQSIKDARTEKLMFNLNDGKLLIFSDVKNPALDFILF